MGNEKGEAVTVEIAKWNASATDGLFDLDVLSNCTLYNPEDGFIE